jgi:hypothetical protein
MGRSEARASSLPGATQQPLYRPDQAQKEEVMTTEELRAHLQHVACQLGEHCNAIQILASVHADGGGTNAIRVGCGDWYARKGLAIEFIEEDQAQPSLTS